MFVDREKGLFLSVYVNDIELAGKRQNKSPAWKILMKDVDLGDPTSFLDHVYLLCTQRECETSKDIVDSYRSMFESRISAGATERLPTTQATGKPDAETISSWSYHMEGHAKKCVERYCALARTKRLDNHTKSQHHACMDDHQFKGEETESVGELSTVLLTNCSDMSVFGSYWEQPDILWSVNKLARAKQNGQNLVATAWRF